MLLQVFNAMLRPMEGSVMTATTAVASGDWSEHVALVFARLDERQQRWVGGLLSAPNRLPHWQDLTRKPSGREESTCNATLRTTPTMVVCGGLAVVAHP
jgi:hypothetical protein